MHYQLAEQSSNSGLKSLLILAGLGLLAWLSCKYLWTGKSKKKRKNPEDDSIPVVVEEESDEEVEESEEDEDDHDEEVKELSKLYRRK